MSRMLKTQSEQSSWLKRETANLVKRFFLSYKKWLWLLFAFVLNLVKRYLFCQTRGLRYRQGPRGIVWYNTVLHLHGIVWSYEGGVTLLNFWASLVGKANDTEEVSKETDASADQHQHSHDPEPE